MTDPKLLAEVICHTLLNKGYVAYFAGGWVRDFLMNTLTDEIDIATNASPNILRSLFSKTIPVGIAFGVVIVVVEGIPFEVSTFRQEDAYRDGRHPESITFSTPEKDAQRRDFTINGMFYDPFKRVIYDYVGGQDDLKKQIVRAIGNPAERFEEDRLRMIRAVRFAARFKFQIEENTADALRSYASSLFPAVSIERVWQEFCKMAAYPHFNRAILLLDEYGLLQTIFPTFKQNAENSLEKIVSRFSDFPLDCPPIVYLLELFPTASLKERLDLCRYLKTSIKEQKLVEFFTHSQKMFSSSCSERIEWAYFYAHPLSPLFLNITAAKLPLTHRLAFTAEHQARQKILSKHIERVQIKKPLVTAHHLQQLGILPSKQMGILLKQAERIAINEDLHSVEEVCKILEPLKFQGIGESARNCSVPPTRKPRD